MISSLLKQMMKHYGLSQKAVAEVLETKLDRVKSLTSGRVDKLTREEADALIRKLHIRGDWLATGEGPMLQSEGEQEFYRRLDGVKSATQTASSVELPEVKQRLLQELLYYAQAGDVKALSMALANCEVVSKDEEALLDNYRHIQDKEDKNAVSKLALRCAEAATQGEDEPKAMKQVKKSAHAKFIIHGDVGQSVDTQTASHFTIDMRKERKKKE
jgi:hypothetical protein